MGSVIVPERAGMSGNRSGGGLALRKDPVFARTNVVPIVTPLEEDGSPVVNPVKLNRYLDHLQALGVTHLFVLGETGEFRQLSNPERLAFADAIVPLANLRGMTVMLNATSGDYEETKSNIARFDRMEGVQAIIVCPMWRSNARFFDDLGKGRILPNKPIVLYNNPGITEGNNIPIEVLDCLGNSIAAVKDSSGSLAQIELYRGAAARNDFRLYIGAEQCMAAALERDEDEGETVVTGIVGATGNLSNAYARMLDRPADERFQAQSRMNMLTLAVTEDRARITAGIKHALTLWGVIDSGRVKNGTSELSKDGQLRCDSFLLGETAS